MKPSARFLVAVSCPLLVVGSGCAQLPRPAELASGAVTFLKSGPLSEEDVLLRFGAPTGYFQGERILTWRLGRTYLNELGPAARSVVPPGDDSATDDWQGTLYNLVVVFDDHRMVERFKLIPVRPG